MKVLIQRVKSAAVTVQDQVVGKIDCGLCIFVGVAPSDTDDQVTWMADKITHLRIFEDDAGKMNLSLLDIGGSALIISQFTLLGDCATGRRPSFTGAGDPAHANALYQKLIHAIKSGGIPTEHGVFGADMLVDIQNNGPCTFFIESPNA